MFEKSYIVRVVQAHGNYGAKVQAHVGKPIVLLGSHQSALICTNRYLALMGQPTKSPVRDLSGHGDLSHRLSGRMPVVAAWGGRYGRTCA
eukprot:3371789-Pyramimonas_sp.AAC.1